MRGTDSEEVPRGKDEKNFEKRVKECLKLPSEKRMEGSRASPSGQGGTAAALPPSSLDVGCLPAWAAVIGIAVGSD